MPDNLRLGKLAHRHDPRTLMLARYLEAALPQVPPAWDWAKVSASLIPAWGMLGNDQYGDCTIAGLAHQVMLWDAQLGNAVTFTDQQVESFYFGMSGGQDSGLVELDVLNKWRQDGFYGHKLLGFAKVDAAYRPHIEAAIWMFGGAYIGLALPISAQTQEVWDVVPGPDGKAGTWGGHAVLLTSFDDDGVTCVTWGMLKKMTWAFLGGYCVTPETRILTADLRWVEAGELKAGDGLLGFDETGHHARRNFGGYARLWRHSIVEAAPVIRRPCYELSFDDGTVVRCSAEHKWLTHHGGGTRWLSTDALVIRKGQASNVVKPLDVWSAETSHDGGYLAAALDGEGHLRQRDLVAAGAMGVAATQVGFTQRNGAMLDHVAAMLREREYAFSIKKRPDGCNTLVVQRRRDALRLLGSVRPLRLLPKFDPRNLGQMSVKSVKLVEKRAIGEQDVVALRTSTGTYLANGLAAHNCDEIWANLPADYQALPAGGVAGVGLDLAALQADLPDLGQAQPSAKGCNPFASIFQSRR